MASSKVSFVEFIGRRRELITVGAPLRTAIAPVPRIAVAPPRAALR
jgi:hypothetical protein